jgi:hypothetical protein
MECPVCYTSLYKGKTCKTTCNHVFHAKCLKKWYKLKTSCPMCRSKPVPPTPEHAKCIEPTCTESPIDEWSVMCAHHLEMSMFRRTSIMVCTSTF